MKFQEIRKLCESSERIELLRDADGNQWISDGMSGFYKVAVGIELNRQNVFEIMDVKSEKREKIEVSEENNTLSEKYLTMAQGNGEELNRNGFRIESYAGIRQYLTKSGKEVWIEEKYLPPCAEKKNGEYLILREEEELRVVVAYEGLLISGMIIPAQGFVVESIKKVMRLMMEGKSTNENERE